MHTRSQVMLGSIAAVLLVLGLCLPHVSGQAIDTAAAVASAGVPDVANPAMQATQLQQPAAVGTVDQPGVPAAAAAPAAPELPGANVGEAVPGAVTQTTGSAQTAVASAVVVEDSASGTPVPLNTTTRGIRRRAGARVGEPSVGIAAVAVCNWRGHCLGDPCRTYNDCDNDWICVSGKCAVRGGPTPPPSPPPRPAPSPSPPAPTPSARTTLTSYNVMSFDNTSPGDLYVGHVSQNFVNNVNIVAVHSKFWSTYGYNQVDITFNGRTGRFVILDMCADSDCPDKVCCTANMNYNGNGFLLDIDSAAARRVFGISNAENTLYATATYKLVPNSRVDFAALQRLYP